MGEISLPVERRRRVGRVGERRRAGGDLEPATCKSPKCEAEPLEVVGNVDLAEVVQPERALGEGQRVVPAVELDVLDQDTPGEPLRDHRDPRRRRPGSGVRPNEARTAANRLLDLGLVTEERCDRTSSTFRLANTAAQRTKLGLRSPELRIRRRPNAGKAQRARPEPLRPGKDPPRVPGAQRDREPGPGEVDPERTGRRPDLERPQCRPIALEQVQAGIEPPFGASRVSIVQEQERLDVAELDPVDDRSASLERPESVELTTDDRDRSVERRGACDEQSAAKRVEGPSPLRELRGCGASRPDRRSRHPAARDVGRKQDQLGRRRERGLVSRRERSPRTRRDRRGGVGITCGECEAGCVQPSLVVAVTALRKDFLETREVRCVPRGGAGAGAMPPPGSDGASRS